MNTRKSMFDQIRDNDHQDDDACHLFYDWFCADSSLERRAKPLMALAKKIAFSRKFDARTSYLFFKNNCPMSGPTYDQLSICDLETGDVIFCLQKRDEWQVYCRANDFKTVTVTGTASHIAAWFNV